MHMSRESQDEELTTCAQGLIDVNMIHMDRLNFKNRTYGWTMDIKMDRYDG